MATKAGLRIVKIVDPLGPCSEVDANYAREEALLKYLVEDLFPANPGSRFVSSADLRRMAAASSGAVYIDILDFSVRVLVTTRTVALPA